VKDAHVFERSAYLVYARDALQEWLPSISIDDVRASILRQLAGRMPVWTAPRAAVRGAA
jgi:hypothetical protein